MGLRGGQRWRRLRRSRSSLSSAFPIASLSFWTESIAGPPVPRRSARRFPACATKRHYAFFHSTFFERRMLFDRELPVAQIRFRTEAMVNLMHQAA
jgi:hypothetical protein